MSFCFFFFQAEDGIRDVAVTGVQTCALPISFGRLLARAPAVFARENIKATERRFLVVGERLGSFAAFLGRPFREYDFYLGIYDALSFFAREACRGSGTESPCVESRLHDLVETNGLDWGADRIPRT